MARIGEDFRVRVATAGASSVSGNVDFTIDSVGTDTDGWLAGRGMTRWGGQEIQPLEGKVVSLSWTVEVGESQSGEEFVQHIADSDGRADLPLRLGDVSRSTDGGSTWTVQATARLVEIEMAQPGRWALRFVDERVIERETEVFGTTDTCSAWPMGTREPFGDYHVAPAGRFVVTEVDTSLDVVHLENDGAIGAIPTTGNAIGLNSQVRRAMKEDRNDDIPDNAGPATGFAEAFDSLRADVFPEGADITDLSNRVTTTTASNLGPGPAGKDTRIADTDPDIGGTWNGVGRQVESQRGGERTTFDNITLFWDDNLPSVGDTYRIRLAFDGHDTNRVVPHHVGGDGGSHYMKIARDQLTAAGVNVDSSRFDTLEADQSLPTGAFRVTSPETLAVWLERNIWQPTGVLPLVNEAGEISPRKVWQTDADEVPDVTALTDLTESVVTEAPEWRQGTDQQVTKLEFEWEALDDFIASDEATPESREPDTDMGADALTPEEKTISREHDRLKSDSVLTKTRRVSLSGIHTKKVAVGLADNMSRRMFNRYGDGAILTEQVPALSSVADETVGSFVVVDVPVYPDADSRSYGAARLLQIASKQYTRQAGKGAVLLDLLDAGPKTQPLAKPTLTATKSSSQPTQAIDVSVSLPSDADGYLLQMAANDSEPASDSDLWTDVHPINDTVLGLASGTTYWFRARATAPNRIASLWSDTDSATTDALTAPSDLSFDEVSGCSFVATWTNGVSDRAVKFEVSGGNVDLRTQLRRGTTRHEEHDGIVGLETSTTYTVTVSHVDGFGGEVSTSADVTTTATPDTGPDPLGVSVLVGRDIQ